MINYTHVFVVDTEQYSGNFERSLVAWMTGRIGDCSVGDEEATMAIEDMSSELYDWFANHVVSVPDDHGCARPAATYPTPGWFNSGHGTHWKEDADPEEVRVAHEKSVRKTYEGYMGIRAWTILPPMLALAVDFIYVALLVHYYSVRIELAALRRTHKPGG